jgi:hypothetical protein
MSSPTMTNRYRATCGGGPRPRYGTRSAPARSINALVEISADEALETAGELDSRSAQTRTGLLS